MGGGSLQGILWKKIDFLSSVECREADDEGVVFFLQAKFIFSTFTRNSGGSKNTFKS